jgi:hypothetical protein
MILCKNQKQSCIFPRYSVTAQTFPFQKREQWGKQQGGIRPKQQQNFTGKTLNPLTPYPAFRVHL